MAIFGYSEWVILFNTVLALIFYYAWDVNQYFQRRRIHFLSPLIFMGNMFKIVMGKQHSLDLTKEAYQKYPDAKYVGLYNFMSPVVIIKDLDIVKNIFVKDFDHFADHINITDDEMDPYLGKRLYSLKGEKWREMRATLSSAFTSRRMREMLPLVTSSSDKLVLYLKKEIEDLKDEGTEYVECELKDLTSRFANDVIASCAFGLEVDSLNNRDNKFYTATMALTRFSPMNYLKLFLYFLSPSIFRLLRLRLQNSSTLSFFHKLIIGTIQTRIKNNIVRHDMIHLLMMAKHGDLKLETEKQTKDSGFATVEETDHSELHMKKQWTDTEMTAQALTFIFAGYETMSNVTSFLLHELGTNPDVQKKLSIEIDDFMINCKGNIDYNSLNNLKYLDMVVSETLRLWPPAIVLDRVCSKPYTLPSQSEGNNVTLKLKKGDGIWISAYDIQRDPKNFEDPDKFNPERFSDENKSSIKPYTFMPFGLGPRACIASRFALMELKVFAVVLLANFEIVPTTKTVYPIKLEPDFYDLIPVDGFWVGFKNRNVTAQEFHVKEE